MNSYARKVNKVLNHAQRWALDAAPLATDLEAQALEDREPRARYVHPNRTEISQRRRQRANPAPSAIQTKEEDASTFSSGGACRFHDHSDTPGWVCRNRTECPYPQGAPVDMPPIEEEEHEKELTEGDVMSEDAAAEDALADYTVL